MPKRVLFICNGNGFRSPLAELLFKKAFGRRYSVASAGVSDRYSGLTVGDVATAEIMKKMKSLGADISGHACRVVDKGLLSRSEYVFVMDRVLKTELNRRFPQYAGRVFVLKEFAGYRTGLDIPNPVGTPFALSMEVYGQIKEAIDRIKRRNLL